MFFLSFLLIQKIWCTIYLRTVCLKNKHSLFGIWLKITRPPNEWEVKFARLRSIFNVTPGRVVIENTVACEDYSARSNSAMSSDWSYCELSDRELSFVRFVFWVHFVWNIAENWPIKKLIGNNKFRWNEKRGNKFHWNEKKRKKFDFLTVKRKKRNLKKYQTNNWQ